MATTLPDINVNMTRGDDETEQNSHSFVTSVKWMPNRNDTLAVAKSDNTIYLWNVEMERCVDQIRDHECRVASLSWNEWVLTSGSFKGLILNHDVRCTKRGNKLSEWSFHRGKKN
jgi:WD40 repeat protein